MSEVHNADDQSDHGSDESYHDDKQGDAGSDEGNSTSASNPASILPEKRLKYRDRGRNNRMNQKKRRILQQMGIVEMPDSFDGHDLAAILSYLCSAHPSAASIAKPSSTSTPTSEAEAKTEFPAKYFQLFPLCHGLLIKLRCGLNRIYRKSEYKFPRSPSQQPEQFYQLVRFMIQVGHDHQDRLLTHFTSPQILWSIAEELQSKSVKLNNDLQKEFLQLPLYPLHYLPTPTTAAAPITDHSATTNYQLQFPQDFLTRVEEYHQSVARPEGTFDLPQDQLEKLKQLAELPRHECPDCHGFRQIYCGPCGGKALESSKAFLPPPIALPFEILLLLHYQESLVKCTGVHAAALCEPGTLSYWNWEKPAEKWQALVEALDPDRDIILFPYNSSIPADTFPWHGIASSEKADSSMEVEELQQQIKAPAKYRLVVLEASWGYGKTMAQQILDHRKSKNLPPIRSVILTNITGEYWRFQAEGQSAVSTIEAIAHTARAAGVSEKEMQDLLILFRLQKYRVLQNSIKPGGKVPRAVEVAGVGIGSWKHVHPLHEI